MTNIKLTVTGAQARASVTGPLTSGMVGLPVAIEYDEAWDALTKNLICRCSPWGSIDGENRAILNVGETASVAHEVMLPDMYLYLGLEGFREDGTLVIPTTWACCGKIVHGANTCEDPSTAPSLSVWNQLQVEMEQLQEQALTQEQAAELQACAQEARQAAEEAKQAAASAGGGLYYTPIVTQPTDNTLEFLFRPSISGAPIPNPVVVQLPGGSSGENVALTTAQINALDGMFRVCAYDSTKDYSGAYAAFQTAFGLSGSGGDTGGDSGEDSGGDIPDTPSSYTVTNNLTNVSSSNTVGSVVAGGTYTATLTAAEGYELENVTVTMGGTDITTTAYAGGVVNIAAVTGNVVIVATATETETEVMLPAGYTRIEYLESSGSESGANAQPIAYINTEYLLEPDDNISVDFSIAVLDGLKAIFGARDGTNHIFARYSTKMLQVYDYSGTAKDVKFLNDNVAADKRYTIKSAGHEWSVSDGTNTDSQSTEGRTGTLTQPLYLFCENNAGAPTATYVSKIRLYGAKITNNGVKANYVPCIDAEGEACLYESVSGKSLYNSGSGEFITGGAVS